MKYSKEIREQALAMMKTERTGIVSEKLHIHAMTLQRWKREAVSAAQEEPEEVVVLEETEVPDQEAQMPKTEPQQPDHPVAKRGRKKKQAVAPADPVVQAQVLLAEDGKEDSMRLHQLEEDNEKLRAENAQLREKCLRYRAALAALIS